MKLIPIHELQEGMVLAEDLYGKFDLLYASRGDVLTLKLIDGLSRLGTPSVYVEDDKRVQSAAPAAPRKQPENAAAKKAPQQDFKDTIAYVYQQYASFKLLNKRMFPKIEQPLNLLLEFVLSDSDVLVILSKMHTIDGYTLNHSIHVSMISALIGQWLGLSTNDQLALAYSGLLHDVGKCMIPVQILNKPTKLTTEEYELVKNHCQYGVDLIDGLHQVNDEVRAAILQHHEKCDGSGYPLKLSGDDIHYYAQIITIADIYAAMTTEKVYTRKLTPLKAADEVFSASCSNLVNPEIANLFLRNIYRMLVGSRVRLSNGQEGEIVYFNRFSPGKPLVKVNDDFIDLYREKDIHIEEIL